MKQELAEYAAKLPIPSPPPANPSKPPGIIVSNEELAEIGKLLGRNIADADDLLLAARNVTTLSIQGLEEGDIVLDSYLLNRLKSRCHPTEYFPTFVRDRVKESLASYAGC